MSDTGSYDEFSSVLDPDQLQPQDTLDGTLGDDVLDDAITPADTPSPTLAGTGLVGDPEHETLDQRIGQELPDTGDPMDPRRPERSENVRNPSFTAEIDALDLVGAALPQDVVEGREALGPEELDAEVTDMAADDTHQERR